MRASRIDVKVADGKDQTKDSTENQSEKRERRFGCMNPHPKGPKTWSTTRTHPISNSTIFRKPVQKRN